MMRFLISISLSLILLSSVSAINLNEPLVHRKNAVLIELNSKESLKFDLSLRIRKHHFNGMLIMKEMPNGDIRIIGTTYFGLSLFDFSINSSNMFVVNKCIEPLQHKGLLRLLERDFKLLLLPNQKKKLVKDTELFRLYRRGSGFGKTYIGVFDQGEETESKVELRHPLIKLYITLHPLVDNERLIRNNE